MFFANVRRNVIIIASVAAILKFCRPIVSLDGNVIEALAEFW